jgi:hypothetical protein
MDYQRLLYVLREKKGKSLAGDNPNDKNEFVIENDVIGDSNKEEVSMKLIRFKS